MLLEAEFVLSSVKGEVAHVTGWGGAMSLVFLHIHVEAYIFTLVSVTVSIYHS